MKKELGLESIISALTNDYERLFWSNIHTGEMRFLPDEKIPEVLKFLLDDYLSHDEKMRLFANKLVDSADRAKFIRQMSSMAIIEAFENCDSYSIRYRSDLNNETNLYETKLFKAPSENGHLCVVYTIRNINELIKDEAEKAAQEQANKTYGIVNALANDYESIILIDVKTDKMSSYRLNSHAEMAVPGFENLKTFDALTNYIKKEYVPLDERDQYAFDIKRSSIADGLAHGDSYKVKHSVVINDTTQHWELKFAYGDNAHTIIVCGIRNIDNVVAQLEEKKHFLQDHARQKAFVDLFADSYISAYYINTIDGHYRVYKSSGIASHSSKPTFAIYGEAMVDFAQNYLDEADRVNFITSTSLETIKEQLAGDAKEYTFGFKAVVNGLNYYFKMRAIRGHDENHVAVGFSDITKEHEKEEKDAEARRQTAIISSLTSDFELVHYVEFKEHAEDDTIIYSKLSNVFSLFPEIESDDRFTNRSNYIRDHIVLPADRDDFFAKTRRDIIVPELRKGHPYFVTFRAGLEENAAYYQLKFTPDLDATGFLKGFVVGIHSIDEQMKKEYMSRIQAEENLKTINEQKKQLEEQHAQLEAANNSKTAFLFNMSHDIRTPMNAITGFADLAEKYIEDKEKALDYISKIQTASDHLLNLINEVLDMSRVESGKITSEIVTVNVVDSVNEIYLMCKESATSRAIDIEFDSGNVPNLPIYADALHVNRILLNIIGNAIKFTRPNGSIKISTKLIENTEPGILGVSYVVEDTGIGMSKEFLSHIYDSFARERTSTNSGVEGTGLGMAIVKKLVDFLGGTIEIKSKVEVGTRVTVNLAFKIAEESKQAPAPVKKKAPKSFEDRVCLLVEDNALNREIAKELLEEQGVTVITAENGKIAVDIVKDFKPETFDFVLMDIQMPIMDGLESAKRIRQIDGAEKLPIIALSANAFAEDRQKSLAVGMNDHVAKPIDKAILFETVAKYMK